MKETRLIRRCSGKNSHLGKWAILDPKIVHPHNAGRIFLKCCPMKGANGYMRLILIIFQKKVWGKWSILGPKMMHPHNSGSAVRIFLNFAQ